MYINIEIDTVFILHLQRKEMYKDTSRTVTLPYHFHIQALKYYHSVFLRRSFVHISFIVLNNGTLVSWFFAVPPNTAWIQPQISSVSHQSTNFTFHLSNRPNMRCYTEWATGYSSLCSLSYERSIASLKASSPYSSIWCFLFQFSASSLFLNVFCC